MVGEEVVSVSGSMVGAVEQEAAPVEVVVPLEVEQKIYLRPMFQCPYYAFPAQWGVVAYQPFFSYLERMKAAVQALLVDSQHWPMLSFWVPLPLA